MKTSFLADFRPGRRFAVCACFCLLTAASLHAGRMPTNLGHGLDALVESNQKLQANPNFSPHKLKKFNGNATRKAAYASANAIKDPTGRMLVRINANGVVPLAKLQAAALAAAPSLKIQATDAKYHGAGVFEGWVALGDVPRLAALEGVNGVFLSSRPTHAKVRPTLARPAAVVDATFNPIGTVFDFGITQHLVDQINQTYNPSAPFDFEGDGMSIGILSDSFDTGTTFDPATGAGVPTHAADDVASGDLPGAPGSTVNAQPVVVLQDLDSPATDEGRGMTQTVFKMAPHARLGFATADFGEVDFGNEIRALAGLLQYPSAIQQGFAADVIVDDVGYFDEPFFQDGIVAQAVNDVVAAGVSYFASAGNDFGSNGYDSDFRFVANGTGLTAATNAALAGTNINLATVPPALYAGGFHNFNPKGLDVAQLVNFPGASVLGTDPVPTILQWNDPDDTTTPSLNPATPVFTGTGSTTYNATAGVANSVPFVRPLTAGQEYYFVLTPAATSNGANFALDGKITVTDPSGNVIVNVDNAAYGDPEYLLFFAPSTGNYTVTVGAYEEPDYTGFGAPYTTDGDFTLDEYLATGTERITQDLNLLVFDTAGNYIAADSTTDNNFTNNSPIEISRIIGPANGQLQFVIARSNQPPASGRAANHLRYVCSGDGTTPLGPAEYIDYTSPITKGHSCAAGANGVAAYAFFRPSIPERFTSPGPATIYFDANNHPLPAPQVRLKPDVAAMDGANTTFFFARDSVQDLDADLNFFGTSNAAPHAAAIGALVIQAHGGRGKLSPAELKQILQGTAFKHDLDPYFASGSARASDGSKVTFSINEDNSNATGSQDPNGLAINFIGKGSLSTCVFNPSGSPTTGGDVTAGNNGITATAPYTYFSNATPGLVFNGTKPFTVGNASSPGLQAAGAAVDTYANPLSILVNGTPTSTFYTMSLAFPTGAFTGGSVLRFAVGRYEANSADVTTAGGSGTPNRSADLMGGGVSLPDGLERTNGMTFSGTTSTGATFNGVIRNRLGFGYSVLDGFGFLNAEAAVLAPKPQ